MAGPVDNFLLERDPTTWLAPPGFPSALTPAGFFAQEASSGLEVTLVSAARKPRVAELREGWLKRRGSRASPLLLVAFYPAAEGWRVALCGPVGDQPLVHGDLEASQVERLAGAALREPTHHGATRFLLANLPELDSRSPGLRNIGLLATHELTEGVPDRADWGNARRQSLPLLNRRGRNLVEGLGFSVQTLATNASMLTVKGRRSAIAVFCDENEPFDAPSNRFDHSSPVSRALALADQEGVDWVILTRASEIRLYAARPDTGVGRKGRAETFVELNLSLLPEELAGYLSLLFSAEALSEGGTLHEVLEDSSRFAAALAERLRERVYHETVPALAGAVAARLCDGRHGGGLSELDLADAYEQVMVILFRLLFVAYAEDKDLLPQRSNARYADHSLTRIALRLTEARRCGTERYDEHATDLWDDVSQLWRAVSGGNIGWGVPAYNGGLFSDDPAVSPSGAALARISLTDTEFGPALAAMLIDRSPEGEGPVDFRSLSVREFGTIYEGLLESKLSVAQDDLAVKVVKGSEQYVPATADEEVEVEAGSVYFHNRSGVRKATGSYFTKPFAVEHLLDHALEPALDDHTARLDSLRDQGDDAALADAFFDFRCADLAMGSAHFLVAAVDRIEARLSAWLTLHPVPSVTEELVRLRAAALGALGDLADGVEIESSSLLRRQVARHCIYGVDKNRVAVELARLAIWVHTFVPGLPLSFLDHNLLQGDSLTGVASIEDAVAAVTPKGTKAGASLFVHELEKLLEGCKEPLARLRRLNDADKAEIEGARAAQREVEEEVEPAVAVFDVATAVRAGAAEIHRDFDFSPESVASLAGDPQVCSAVERLTPIHFPTAWPEVFARTERCGFDCLLGNPPWEKVVVDREVWWGMHLPGVRSQPVAVRRARIDTLEAQRPDLAREFDVEKKRAEDLKQLLRATFPRLGSGQTDLYKAFAWANLGLCREGGRIGLVLPRSAVSDAGMSNWRTEIVEAASDAASSARVPPRALPPPPPPPPDAAVCGDGHQSQGLGVRGGPQLLHGGVGGGHPLLSVVTCLNTRQWAFDGIDGRYTVALVAVRKLSPRAEPRGWL